MNVKLSKEVLKSNFQQYGQMEKQRWEESERTRKEVRRSERRKSEKKEDRGAWKGRKVTIHCVFPIQRVAKAAGAKPSGQMKDKELHAVVARSTCGSKKLKTFHVRTTFGSWDVKKVHAVVARSTFRSKNVQTTSFAALLEVDMLKKRTPLWHEAPVQVKMYKAHHVRATFGSWHVENVHAVVAQSTCPCQNAQSTPTSDHFWKLTCRKSHAVVARSTFRSKNVQTTSASQHF